MKIFMATLLTLTGWTAFAKTQVVSTLSDHYSKDEIRRAFQQAEANGAQKIIFSQPLGLMDGVFKASTQQQGDLFPAGDYFFLVGGLTGSDSDSTIRFTDYNAVHSSIERASFARFRIIVNLFASADDLRQALQNDRPTLIVWSGHGSENGYFYDASHAPVPPEIFKATSPHVYQYIHSSCYGTLAIGKTYKLPASIKSVAWEGLTDSADLKAYLESKHWTPFAGRTETVQNQGLKCVKEVRGDGYLIKNSADEQMSPSVISNLEYCASMIYNIREGFLCAGTKYGIDIISLQTKKVLPGVSYNSTQSDLYSCFSKIRSSRQGLICRRLKRDQDRFAFVRSIDGSVIESPQFKSLDQCSLALSSTTEI
jgi:hypothetical protein